MSTLAPATAYAAGSFRDRGARVFHDGGRVLRALSKDAAAEWRQVSGVPPHAVFPAMLFRFWIEVTASRRKRRVALADLVNVKPVNTDRQTGKGRLNSHTIGRFGERRATHDLASCVSEFCLSAFRFERTRSGCVRRGLGEG